MATAVTAGLCAFAAVMLLTVWSRRTRERQAGVRTSRTPATDVALDAPVAPAAAPLDELINDALPLVEEDPAFPANMSFHGRTLGFRYLLLSGPHGLRGPHFTAGQISPRLRDRAGTSGGRGASGPIRPIAAPTPSDDLLECRADEEDAAATDIVQPKSDVRIPSAGRRQPSPLERALLARRGRSRP